MTQIPPSLFRNDEWLFSVTLARVYYTTKSIFTGSDTNVKLWRECTEGPKKSHNPDPVARKKKKQDSAAHTHKKPMLAE